MKTSRRLCPAVFAILILNTGWTANLRAQPKATVSRGELPFRLYGGYLIVMEGRIGDRGKLKFVLDTGVTHSVIDHKVADRISAPRHQSGKVLNFDKLISAAWVEIPEIEFGPVRASNFPMMIGNLQYFQSYATQVDAVIGLDVLRLSSFSIAYDAHRVTFGPVNTPSGVPLDVGAFCMSVQLMVGESKVRVLVDTGAPTLVLYEDRLGGRLPQLKIQRETTGLSMGGWVHSKQAFIPNAKLGATNLEGTVFLVNAPSGSFLADVDGYLGAAALKAHRLAFNFETSTLAWKK